MSGSAIGTQAIAMHGKAGVPRWRRFGAIVLATMLIASCASTHVVRRAGGDDLRPVRVSVPKPGKAVSVRAGQTLYRIATENGITARDLAAWNDVDPPYTIFPGQTLRLYPPARGGAAGTRATATAPARAPGTAAATPSRPPAPRAAAPAASPFAWRWPVDGTLLSGYVAGDVTRQGIDIGNSEGTPVRAAADGVVVYSGSGLVGYGELVIVKHDDNWLSAYGHNRARTVNEGQVVKAGQQIAEMGHTGAPRDLLHFEIRYNGKPVDPLRYLPAR
jgi:lipoprotein NlpD